MRTPVIDPWDTEGPVCMTGLPGLAVTEPGAGAGRAAGGEAACSGATGLGLARPGAWASPAHGVADLRRHNVPPVVRVRPGHRRGDPSLDVVSAPCIVQA